MLVKTLMMREMEVKAYFSFHGFGRQKPWPPRSQVYARQTQGEKSFRPMSSPSEVWSLQLDVTEASRN